MTASLDNVLTHLEKLVAFDTRNPPRQIDGEGIFAYLQSSLRGFKFELSDHGAGAVSLLAMRGNPKRVFNFHIDTVPSAEGWSSDPLKLTVSADRASGLGACDIKGAAACMLEAAANTTGDLALLFSSDEEANDARCIAAFLKKHHEFSEAIVAEPTLAKATLSHRGIVSVLGVFDGSAGHASEPRALIENAVHRAAEWAHQALAHVKGFADLKFGELSGFRFNLGRIEGGIKGNVIAPSCEIRFNFRPLPSQSVDDLLTMFKQISPDAHWQKFEPTFFGPALPAIAGKADKQLEAARQLAESLSLTLGPAVNFWTEASLFSQAGMTALVYGPGDIAQAHAVDEWVALDQLQQVADTYQRIIQV